MQVPQNKSNTFTNPFFIGKVEDNKDPTFNYRIKVRIEKLHNEIGSIDQLPWAARVDSTFLGMKDNTAEKHVVPVVGSEVLLVAIGNDPNSLVYLGSLYKKVDGVTPEEDDDYLQNWGIYGKDGHFIGLNKVETAFQLLMKGELDILVDQARNITIKAKNNIKIECESANVKATKDVNVTCKNATVKADENTNVECKTSTVKASSSINFDTPKAEFTGTVHVQKTINCDATITAAGNVRAAKGSVSLLTHTHMYSPGSNPPTTTAPGKG